MFEVRVQTEDFDVAREVETLRQGSSNIGALVNFVGLMRRENDGHQVFSMTLEHYPGMTEKALADIVAQARKRWLMTGAKIIHRVGTLQPGDQIVFVGVTSAHRQAAFQACEFIMDFLKTQAPFWKKEQTSAGAFWVEAKQSDEAAAKTWSQGS